MTARVVVIGALAAAAVVVAALLFTGGSGYTVHARFANAGQLVTGGDVTVAGRRVGTIRSIDLTDDGQADVELAIADDDFAPLHAGTRATIRAVGQAGVANRFVDLVPGSARTAEVPDGGVLPATQTTGIVTIDELLDMFDPAMRESFGELMRRGDEVFAGSGSAYYNAMLAKLAPALGEVRRMTGELASDGAQLGRLISTAEQAATTVASRRPDLVAALDSSARWLAVLARERESVADVFRDAPAALEQGRITLADAATAVTDLRPVLRDIPAATPALGEVLDGIRTTLPAAAPMMRNLAEQLPGLRRSLDGLAPLQGPLIDSFTATRQALVEVKPILRPLRLYAPDLILGIVNGLAGVAVGNYDAVGHYTRLEFVQPPQTLPGGQLADVLSSQPIIPGLFEQKIRQTRRCPGGALPPAPDNSNANVAGEPLCDPTMNMQEDVNRP